MKIKLGCLLTVLALVAGVLQAAAQSSTVFPIATNAAASQAGIFAAFGRTNYLVGIQGDGTTNYTAISAQLISTNGTLAGSRILPGRSGGIPYVAFGGTNFLLLWSDDALVASGGNDQVYGQFVTQSGTLAGSPFTFGPTSEEQDMQGGGGSLLAFDGKNYLAVWDTGGFHDSPGGDIHGALFNQTGSLVVPIISITSETNGALTPTVAFGKTNYLVVWDNRRPAGPEEYDIYGEFISTNGTQGNAFVISQTPTPSYDPCCAAFDGTNFLVVWDKNIGSASPDTIWNLYGRVISADGTFPGSEVAMVTDANNQGGPSLAFDGSNYLLALPVGVPSPNTQVVFQFFNPAASSIGPQFYLFSPQGANLPFASGVLYDGSRFEITAAVGGGVGIGSEGEDFSAGTGTYGTFLSTNAAAAAVLNYAYSTNFNGLSVTITAYSGPGGTVTIPATINNLAVTGIGSNAFHGNASLASVIIPSSVTNLAYEAFADCTNLTGVDFEGDAPGADPSAFNGDNYATAYYLPGATGWHSTFAGIPAALSIPDSLQVTMSPPSAVTAGAQWQVDGGTWQNSGATVSNLSAGSHSVSFNTVSGWTAPASQIVFASVTWTATALGEYLLQGQFIYTTNNGSITITGYTGSTGAVTIPATINNLPVTAIGQNAFKELNLTSVTIPDSVTSIGDHAFDTCTSLASVTIGSGVTSIGEFVFQGCFGLTNVTIDNGVTSIGGWMFADCSSLTSVVIPDSVTGIGEEAFSYCTRLTNVMIGNGVTSIGEISFQGCFSLTSITIPGSVTSIGDGAFSYTSLVSVLFDSNAPTADSTVFANGYNSTTAYYIQGTSGWGPTFAGLPALLWDPLSLFGYTISNGAISIAAYLGSGGGVTIPSVINNAPVTSIGESVLEGPSATSITIPNSVTNIASGAFGGCFSLRAITVSPGNPVYNSLNGVLFDQSLTTLIQYPGGLIGSYAIPGSVTNVGANAFEDCTNLTSVTIPASVTDIGDYAFYDCTSLTSVTIPNSVPSLGIEAFVYCTSLTNVTVAGNINDFAGEFSGCDNLTHVTIANGSASIGAEEFYNDTTLTSVTIPSSVTDIGYDAFAGTGLTSVAIPNSVTSLGAYAFVYCANLSNVTVPGNIADFGDEFYGCSNLTHVTIANGSTSIVANAFYNETNLTSVTIPDSVISIGDYAFYDCSNLTSVTIPSSVVSLGEDAFAYCNRINIYFEGNAPIAYTGVFYGDFGGVYYFPGTTGWAQFSINASVTVIELPAIAVNANHSSGMVPLTVSFTSARNDSAGNSITNWTWSFGDGSSSAAQNPSHTYTNTGNFSATLIETNNSGATIAGGGASLSVYGGTVAFTAAPTNGVVPLTVSFTSASVDSGGNAVTGWEWTFGDGSTSNAQDPSHTFTTSGTFSPSLIATNSVGEMVIGLGPAAITTTLNTNCFSPPSGLVSWWPGQSNALDIAGGNNGTLTGGVTFANGEVGQAFHFDGATGFVSTSLLVTNPQSFSLSLWFRTTTTQGGVLMGFGQSKSNTVADYDRNLYLNDTGTIYFGVFDPTYSTEEVMSSAPGYNDGLWHQVVASLSPSTGISLYVDGVLIENDPIVNSAASYNGYWIIGENNLGGWPFQPSSDYFNGEIDEISVFNRALSSYEVQSIYYAASAGMCQPEPVVSSVSATSAAVGGAITIQGTNLFAVAAVMFDGAPAQFVIQSSGELIVSVPTNATTGPITLETLNGGLVTASSIFTVTVQECTPPPSGLISWWPGQSNALDIAGGNNGTLAGGVTFANGEVGQAFNLDGATGFISTLLLVTNPQSFSLSLWFRTVTTRGGVLMGFGQSQSNTTANYDRNLYLDNTGTIHFGVFDATEEVVNSAAGYNDDLWHQVVASLSPSTGISLYVDGVLTGNNPAASSAASYNGYWIMGENNLGGWPFQPSSDYFNGEIDEISVFNRALSSSEVQSIYAAGSAGMCHGLIFDTSPTGLQRTINGLELRLNGLTELAPVVIYASSNLVLWTPIYTNPPVVNPIQFLDSTATNLPFRFYRATQQ